MKASVPKDVDEYLAGLENEVARELIARVRAIVREVSPEATELIGYGMPGFKLNGKPLIYFSAFKNHFSMFGMNPEDYTDRLNGNRTSSGTIQFPYKQAFPEELIRDIIRDQKAKLRLDA